jgi:hypothetical protein
MTTWPPTVVQKPALWWIGIVVTECAKRHARNETSNAPKGAKLLYAQLAALPVWRDSGAPEDFVCHPVSDPGKSALQKKDRLNRRPAMSPHELLHFRLSECA